MRYCYHCGNQIGEDGPFCPFCGADQGVVAEPSVENRAKNLRFGGLIVGFAALGVIIVLGIVFLKGRTAERTDAPTKTAEESPAESTTAGSNKDTSLINETETEMYEGVLVKRVSEKAVSYYSRNGELLASSRQEYDSDGKLVTEEIIGPECKDGHEILYYNQYGDPVQRSVETNKGPIILSNDWIYEFDENENPTTAIVKIPGDYRNWCEFQYYPNGSRSKMRRYECSGNWPWSEDDVVTDYLGELIWEKKYYSNGVVRREMRKNWDLFSWDFQCTREYDLAGNLLSYSSFNKVDGTTTNIVYNYDFDANGNVISYTKHQDNVFLGYGMVENEYDKDGDLIKSVAKEYGAIVRETTISYQTVPE